MLVTCQSHAIHMPVTCQSHASHIPVTCQSHASHMQVTCKSHASHIYIPVICKHHLNHISGSLLFAVISVNYLCPVPFIHPDWSQPIQSKSNVPLCLQPIQLYSCLFIPFNPIHTILFYLSTHPYQFTISNHILSYIIHINLIWRSNKVVGALCCFYYKLLFTIPCSSGSGSKVVRL